MLVMRDISYIELTDSLVNIRKWIVNKDLYGISCHIHVALMPSVFRWLIHYDSENNIHKDMCFIAHL